MKQIILLLLFTGLIFTVTYSQEKSISTIVNDNTNDDLYSDEEKEYIKNNKNKKQDSQFKNINWDWNQEKYKSERTLISIGVVSLTIGFAAIVTGLLTYTLPQTDKSLVGSILSLSLLGAGGALLATGTTFTVIGVIKLNDAKSKDKTKVSFIFGSSA